MKYKVDHKKLQELTSDDSQHSRYADIVSTCVERWLGLQVLTTPNGDAAICFDEMEEFLVEAKVLVKKTK